MLDIWQQPITDMGQTGPDKGKGGKYLILPPGSPDSPSALTTWARTSEDSSDASGTSSSRADSRMFLPGSATKSSDSPGSTAAPRRATIPRPHTPCKRVKTSLPSLAALPRISKPSLLRVKASWARRRTRMSACDKSSPSAALGRFSNPSAINSAASAASFARHGFSASSEYTRPSSCAVQPPMKSVTTSLPSHEYSASVTATPQFIWRESASFMPAPSGSTLNDQIPEFAAPPR